MGVILQLINVYLFNYIVIMHESNENRDFWNEYCSETQELCGADRRGGGVTLPGR